MKNLSLSDMMHTFPLKGFQISGNFDNDIRNYIEDVKMPIWKQNFDNESFVFPLLRLSFGKNITVHTLTDGVVEKVKHTKLENMPTEIPKFMQHPFLIEGRRNKPLYDDVYSIGGFLYKNEICLITKTVTENVPGLFCQREKASFDGRKIEDMNLLYNKNFSLNKSYIEVRTRKDTFSFLIVFSLILEAEKTLLLIENTYLKSKKKGSDKKNVESGWITKRVYIDKSLINKNKNEHEHDILDKNGKLLKDVNVRSYLRRQHYGIELSETKWIYIESYESKRWTKDIDKKIIVDKYDKN